MASTCLSTEKLIIPNYVLFDTIRLVFETSFRTFDTYRNSRMYTLKILTYRIKKDLF